MDSRPVLGGTRSRSRADWRLPPYGTTSREDIPVGDLIICLDGLVVRCSVSDVWWLLRFLYCSCFDRCACDDGCEEGTEWVVRMY